jgi:uroporphyrinogen-III synthase
MILLTRPIEDSHRTAMALSKVGIASLIAPIATVEHMVFDIPMASYDGYCITSYHALRALATMPAAPCFVVGERLSHAINAMGYHCAASAPTIHALLPLIHQKIEGWGRVLYIRGEEITLDIGRHVPCDACIAYTIAYHDILPSSIHQALMGHPVITGLAFFSCKAATHFYALVHQAGLEDRLKKYTVFVLSEAIKTIVTPFPHHAVVVAKVPTLRGMVGAIWDGCSSV